MMEIGTVVRMRGRKTLGKVIETKINGLNHQYVLVRWLRKSLKDEWCRAAWLQTPEQMIQYLEKRIAKDQLALQELQKRYEQAKLWNPFPPMMTVTIDESGPSVPETK